MDKWLLSRLNTLITEVDTRLDNYQIPEAARALQDFVDECSNWYVRRSRERFWAKGMEQDKINAYMTLYTALVTLAKLSAPMIPFMAEEIYLNLVRSIDKNAPESVHLCDFRRRTPRSWTKSWKRIWKRFWTSSLWDVPAAIPPTSRTVSPSVPCS